MKYRTKKERRVREELLRTLGREYKRLVNGMASSYAYAGAAYEHRVDELDAVNARIREVYLQD